VQTSVVAFRYATRVRAGETHLGSFGSLGWERIAQDRADAAPLDSLDSTVPKLLVRADVFVQRHEMFAIELKDVSFIVGQTDWWVPRRARLPR
jgi:hypothetical protein